MNMDLLRGIMSMDRLNKEGDKMTDEALKQAINESVARMTEVCMDVANKMNESTQLMNTLRDISKNVPPLMAEVTQLLNDLKKFRNQLNDISKESKNA